MDEARLKEIAERGERGRLETRIGQADLLMLTQGDVPRLVAEIRTLQAKLRRAIKTLERYKDCRHASINCSCTKEAREVLAEYP